MRDSLTAVAYFKRHTPEQFYDLVYQVSIVPEHILHNTPAAQLKTADVARRGIGSGRFRLAKWEPGKRIELVADTANYRGRPKLDRIVYVPTPDFNTAITRFFAGDADFFEQLRPEHIAKIAGDTARRAIPYPNSRLRVPRASTTGMGSSPTSRTRSSATGRCAARSRWRSIGAPC